MLKDKQIFVTGAAGSIGSELVRQLANDNSLYCLDNNETELFNLLEELRLEGKKIQGRVGDIRDIETLDECINGKLIPIPDIIFHVAALKHVTTCEWNPEEATRTNILGTLNVIKVAKKYNIKKLISISTDKVVNSDSVMGVSKRMCELIIRNAGYVSVRFANVLGSRGSIIPIWQKQADEGKPLTITDPGMERYFMSMLQAVGLVISASEIGEPGDIIVLDMGKPIKIIDLAKKIIEASGRNIPIEQIGIRPGESLTEKLMTGDEMKSAIKKDNFWIIKNG